MEINELATLISTAPPPFVFVHDAVCLRDTTRALEVALISEENAMAHVQRAVANGISCFAPRLLYDHVINSLAGWSVEWYEGCADWTLPSFSGRWNDSFDSFIRGLRTLHSHIRSNRAKVRKAEGDRKTRERKKGEGRQRQVEGDIEEEVRFAIIIEHAERLRSNVPDLLVPLTRLAELTRLDITVVFISQVRWEDMKPPLGASLDPYFIDIPPPMKEGIVTQLEENFDSATKSIVSHHADASKPRRGRSRNVSMGDQCPPSPSLPGLYHPSLRQLYNDFISILCDVCYPFTHDRREIQYIAAARWPGFVQPVLDEHNQRMERLRRRAGRQPGDMEIDEEYDNEDEGLRPPSADTRSRLSRLFKPTLTSALEELYPRITNANAWAQLNASPPDPDSISLSRPSSPVKPREFDYSADPVTVTPQTPRRTRSLRSSAPNTPHTPHTPYTPRAACYTHTYASDRNRFWETGLSSLPRLSKFILIAAFLASTNPAKSDIRMFGRGLDEKKRRKRRASSPTKAGNGPAKMPQRLLGPTPFPFDRLIAILGSLLEENDIDGDESRAPADDMFHAPGEYTDMEVMRVGVYTAVVELVSMWLLHRTSPVEKIEGPPMFKCGISYEGTLGLAKELDVPLNDLLWDTV